MIPAQAKTFALAFLLVVQHSLIVRTQTPITQARVCWVVSWKTEISKNGVRFMKPVKKFCQNEKRNP